MIERFPDIESKTEEEQFAILRTLSPWQSLQIVNDLTSAARKQVLDTLRQQFPEDGPVEIRRRFATVWLGTELAARVYGPEPDPPTAPFPIDIVGWPPLKGGRKQEKNQP